MTSMFFMKTVCIVLLVKSCGGAFSLSPQPSLTKTRISEISFEISEVLNGVNGDKADRYASAREMASAEVPIDGRVHQQHELVYGELSVEVLAELLDAVGVEEGDKFLDIGSGDGALVFGAAMLYPNHFRVSRGLELVPGLYERSMVHAKKLRTKHQVPTELYIGDVHQAHHDTSIASILSDTTLSVCFATTWSADRLKKKEGRKLPKLSQALTKMPKGSRILIVDGRLEPQDGYYWAGDMNIHCPDTAPFSIASLYERL